MYRLSEGGVSTSSPRVLIANLSHARISALKDACELAFSFNTRIICFLSTVGVKHTAKRPKPSHRREQFSPEIITYKVKTTNTMQQIHFPGEVSVVLVVMRATVSGLLTTLKPEEECWNSEGQLSYCDRNYY